jgi:Pyruvate/2-oxoacid:ferredoxin oxidoreductase gamma subunit
MTGHSISEVILSPEEIYYTGIERPDIFMALAPEGLKAAHRQFNAMTRENRLYIRRDLLPVDTETQTFPLEVGRVSKKEIAITVLSAVIANLDLYPLDALREAIQLTQRPEIAAESLKAVERSSTILN